MKNVMGYVTLERNGKTADLFPEEVSIDRIEALKVTFLCQSFNKFLEFNFKLRMFNFKI